MADCVNVGVVQKLCVMHTKFNGIWCSHTPGAHIIAWNESFAQIFIFTSMAVIFICLRASSVDTSALFNTRAPGDAHCRTNQDWLRLSIVNSSAGLYGPL